MATKPVEKDVTSKPVAPVEPQPIDLSASSSAGLTPVEAKTKPAMMEVPVDKMQAILDTLEKQSKDIQLLQSVANQTRLEEAKATLDVDKRSRVYFKKLQGKVVIGWGQGKQEPVFSSVNPSMQVGEILKSQYYFLDGTQSDWIDQVEFVRSNEMVFARVVEDRGNTALLEFEDKSVASEPIEIHKKFWNA